MFVVFIICCGCTHFVGMISVWIPVGSYIAATVVKFLTALISFVTAVSLFQAIPQALTFPSREILEKEISVNYGRKFFLTNMKERKDAQRKLQDLYDRGVVTAAIIDKIRLPFKVNDILAVAASQMKEAFQVDKCTIHLLEGDYLVCHAEYPEVYPSSPYKVQNTSDFLSRILSCSKATQAHLFESTGDPLLELIHDDWGTSSVLCARTSNLDNNQGKKYVNIFLMKL
jgi:hypothetical protein